MRGGFDGIPGRTATIVTAHFHLSNVMVRRKNVITDPLACSPLTGQPNLNPPLISILLLLTAPLAVSIIYPQVVHLPFPDQI